MTTILLTISIITMLMLCGIIILLIKANSKDAISEGITSIGKTVDQRLKEVTLGQHQLETTLLKQQISAQESTYIALQDHFRTSNQTLTENLNAINNKVSDSLEKGFKNSHETFTDVIKRLTMIDETQKKIDALSTDIISLQDVLTDKKTRGIFGEVQLNQILSSIFGPVEGTVYQLQYPILSGRVDAALFLPQPLGIVPIDSKFPLENYRRMIESPSSSLEYQTASKGFIADCKTHIQAIADKYIQEPLNIHQAMMFIPAEAIFANINAYHPEIIDFAQTRNVWIVSPTTLMSTLTTIQVILKDMQQQKHAAEIKHHLARLAIEFDRYEKRWEKLSRSIKTVSKDVDDITTTSNKIIRRFDDINNVNILDSSDPSDLKID